MKKLFGVVLISLGLVACGGGSGEKAEAPAPKSMINSKAEEKPAAKPADLPEVAEIVIEGNDQMKFNLDKIEVYAGQKVKLTLKHVGEMPLQSMGHNWTLLAKGVDVMEFGAATATGQGEDVIRICGSHLVVELMRMGNSPEEACKKAVERIIKIKNISSCSLESL
mgnify:CR=1 FL=1